MSNKTEKARIALQEPKSLRQAAFPVWAPVLVMLAVILTGVVLAFEGNAVSKGYFILFAIASLAVTLLVEARALFITVASLPIYFVVGTVAIGWISAPDSGGAGRRQFIINSLYPSISNFMWLLLPLLACIIIAALRWWLYREDLMRRMAYWEHMRRHKMAAERNNRQAYSRARATRSEYSRDERREGPREVHEIQRAMPQRERRDLPSTPIPRPQPVRRLGFDENSSQNSYGHRVEREKPQRAERRWDSRDYYDYR